MRSISQKETNIICHFAFLMVLSEAFLPRAFKHLKTLCILQQQCTWIHFYVFAPPARKESCCLDFFMFAAKCLFFVFVFFLDLAQPTGRLNGCSAAFFFFLRLNIFFFFFFRNISKPSELLWDTLLTYSAGFFFTVTTHHFGLAFFCYYSHQGKNPKPHVLCVLLIFWFCFLKPGW